MVALLVSLKLRLLRGSLRGSLSQRIGLILAALGGLGLGLSGAAGMVALRWAPADLASAVLVPAGTVLVTGWAVVPLLISGVDQTLDPARFALLPVSSRRLVPGLLLAGLVGVPGLATALVAAATVVTWSRGVVPVLLAIGSAAVGLLMCVLASRLTTTAAARVISSRRFRELGTVLSVVLLTAFALWPLLLDEHDVDYDQVEAVYAALGWTPMGLAWAAPADAATGHLWRGVARLGIAAGFVVLGALVWTVLLDRALTDTASGGMSRARVGSSVLEHLPDGPVWAVAGRSLRYWRRDPRYLIALAGIVVGTLLPLLLSWSTGSRIIAVGMGPFVGIMFGIATGNDVGYDGSAFTTHLLLGVQGKTDRWGRALAAVAVGLPLVAVASVAGAVLSGHGPLWPASLGAGTAGLFGGIGAAAIGSALLPYPVPEAGSNPFNGTGGGGARAALAQGAVLSVASAFAAPSVGLLIAALCCWPPANWLGLVLSLVTAPLALWAGIEIGGVIMDDRGPEILASVRKST